MLIWISAFLSVSQRVAPLAPLFGSSRTMQNTTPASAQSDVVAGMNTSGDCPVICLILARACLKALSLYSAADTFCASSSPMRSQTAKAPRETFFCAASVMRNPTFP